LTSHKSGWNLRAAFTFENFKQLTVVKSEPIARHWHYMVLYDHPSCEGFFRVATHKWKWKSNHKQ